MFCPSKMYCYAYSLPYTSMIQSVVALMESAEKLHKKIGLTGMSRTDFRVDKNGHIYALDVNDMPNMDPERSLLPAICQYNGVAIMDLIKRIMDNSDYVSGSKNETSGKIILKVSM